MSIVFYRATSLNMFSSVRSAFTAGCQSRLRTFTQCSCPIAANELKISSFRRQYTTNADDDENDDSGPGYEGPLPKNRLSISFAKSGGPGGQNVNNVNTKAEVRFKLDDADWIPAWVRKKLREQQANKINKDGELVISSQRTRTQKGNLDDAFEKLEEMLYAASEKPKETSEEKRSKIKHMMDRANEKRLEEKKMFKKRKDDRRVKF
eukprot:Colp12_sorted_trinity150504_noHs@12117